MVFTCASWETGRGEERVKQPTDPIRESTQARWEMGGKGVFCCIVLSFLALVPSFPFCTAWSLRWGISGLTPSDPFC
eukprot:355132-Chlamydomonas_euryale.AAC.3